MQRRKPSCPRGWKEPVVRKKLDYRPERDKSGPGVSGRRSRLTTELSDAGGPQDPYWQRIWPARIRSSDFVRWPHPAYRRNVM
jgi:hypothetical protein